MTADQASGGAPTVLQFAFEHPPYILGGIGPYALACSAAVDRHTSWLTVSVAAPAAGPAGHAVWVDSFGAYRAPAEHRLIKKLHASEVHQGMLMAARRAIEDHGAPILVTCQETKSFTAAAEVARAFGVPLISTVHSTERRRRLTANLNPSQQAQHDLRMTMVRNSDAVIAVSHALRDDLVAEAPDVTDRVRVIHSTVSPVFADCRSTAARSSGSDGVLTIGYVGRLAVEKGVDRLPGILAALHELQPDLDVRLVIAGQGHLSAQLHMDLQALPSNVHYELLGSVPPSTMPQVYTACDLLLAPSRSDSFPLAILEAMSLGVPVIASDVGGIPESVQSGVSGLLVGKTAGPEEWAMHIVKCLSPEARDDLAASASLAFETRFSPELFASRLVDLYEEVSA